MKQQSAVKYYDTITLRYSDGREKSFRVNVKKNPDNKIYIGKKLGEWINDIYGRACRITGIQPNDPYEGLEKMLPVRSVDRYGFGTAGKGRKWRENSYYPYTTRGHEGSYVGLIYEW